MITGAHKDLIVLLADLDMENAVQALLNDRRPSLGLGDFTFEIVRHPGKDAGVRLNGHEILRSHLNSFDYALVLFDHDGSGREGVERSALEAECEARLARSGWKERSAVVVLKPELEAWVWSDSPHVAEALGWADANDLAGFLQEKGWFEAQAVKPPQPKEAMWAALRKAGKPFSARIFSQLGQRVGLERCQDDSFLKFKRTLQAWFPA